MNMFKAFENRISEAFGASQQGLSAPISFRKLAKRAAKEMEQETYVIDGINTAPALITILVSADDDAAMRPVYDKLATEVANFVEAEAARKGYVFVGKPLARFMVDPSLRRGRFAVFANNVDAFTLEKLREEERAFLSGFSAFGGAASPSNVRPQDVRPAEQQALRESDGMKIVEHPVSDDSSAGLNVLPADFVDASLSQVSAPTPAAYEARSLAESLPEVIDAAANPIVTPVPEVVGQRVAQVPEVTAPPVEVIVPGADEGRAKRMQDSTVNAAPIPVVEQQQEEPETCLLIDRQSGRTYVGTAPETPIGRERSRKAIVLNDPNVSRRHARLTYDGRSWHLSDLNSTNGTLVNDVDIDSCVLRDGDLITLGMLNLEFRES